MSTTTIDIVAGLEKALKAISPPIDTWCENDPDYTPTEGVPYQRAYVLFAEPLNDEMGGAFQEQGYLQVVLLYPLGEGWGDARERAELIRSSFQKAQTIVQGATKIQLPSIVEISNGRRDGDRWVITTKTPFFANAIG